MGNLTNYGEFLCSLQAWCERGIDKWMSPFISWSLLLVSKELDCAHWIIEVGERHFFIKLIVRYVSPVNPAIYPHPTLMLMNIGIICTAWFFFSSTKSHPQNSREISLRSVDCFSCNCIYGLEFCSYCCGWEYTYDEQITSVKG